ncbi:DUF4190 domain-containing protein [Streptomyces sp. URMC 126]|uniref:DUF4190 domain-containing protein n=1 Tax=Streptomyces sp. URMC 126 TaxID=3423401 RepID=UPI003F19B337
MNPFASLDTRKPVDAHGTAHDDEAVGTRHSVDGRDAAETHERAGERLTAPVRPDAGHPEHPRHPADIGPEGRHQANNHDRNRHQGPNQDIRAHGAGRRFRGGRAAGTDATERRRRNADFMAVTSFVTGLLGLLIANIVFGPCAIALGATALARGTVRRFRARLGMVLGVLGLVLYFVLSVADGTPSWHL